MKGKKNFGYTRPIYIIRYYKTFTEAYKQTKKKPTFNFPEFEKSTGRECSLISGFRSQASPASLFVLGRLFMPYYSYSYVHA